MSHTVTDWIAGTVPDLDRRTALRLGLLSPLALGGLGCAARRTPAPRAGAQRRPNFILLLSDDQGWGDVGYNGSPIASTPVLDSMAASAMRFDRFYAAAPVCSPTRASCLTGRAPSRSNVIDWGFDMEPREQTLPQVLAAAGYATGHFGKWHLGGMPEINGETSVQDRGQRDFDGPLHPGGRGFQEWFSARNSFDLDPVTFVHNGQPVGPLDGEGSEIIVDQASRWIRSCVDRDQPFFAAIWFSSPHTPYMASDSDLASVRGKPDGWQQRTYAAELHAMDRSIGTLRETLRTLGVADDTLLWFTSDNGCSPLGHTSGLRGGKADLWEGGIRVPGLLEWPGGLPRPARSNVPVVTSDLMPTMVELAGARDHVVDRPRDGISLVPLLAATRELGDWVSLERPQPIFFDIRRGLRRGDWATVIDGPLKFHLVRSNAQHAASPPAGTWIYDVEADPGERNDLSVPLIDTSARMLGELEAWEVSVDASQLGKDYTE